MKHILVLGLAYCIFGASLGVAQESSLPGRMKQRRAAILEKFDADKNGRLDATEREALRKSYRQVGRQRREEDNRRDPDTIRRYDEDGDGKLNGKESANARAQMMKIWGKLSTIYDKNKNDNLEVEELDQMEKDARAKKVGDFPNEMFGWIAWVRARARKPAARGGNPLDKFDTDKDGRLSAKELVAVRAAMKQALLPIVKVADESKGDSADAKSVSVTENAAGAEDEKDPKRSVDTDSDSSKDSAVKPKRQRKQDSSKAKSQAAKVVGPEETKKEERPSEKDGAKTNTSGDASGKTAEAKETDKSTAAKSGDSQQPETSEVKPQPR